MFRNDKCKECVIFSLIFNTRFARLETRIARPGILVAGVLGMQLAMHQAIGCRYPKKLTVPFHQTSTVCIEKPEPKNKKDIVVIKWIRVRVK